MTRESYGAPRPRSSAPVAPDAATHTGCEPVDTTGTMLLDPNDAPRLAILGVPSSAGARRAGQEEGPKALRTAGLVTNLAELGLAVRDGGDLPQVGFRPDPENPRAQNAGLVRQVARAASLGVRAVADGGEMPVVLGGDCTISLGVVAGLLRSDSTLGLLYLDADLDLNTPETTPTGILDGMVTAHLLGRGLAELAGIGPARPLIEESRLTYFGYDESGGGVDPQELAALERSSAPRYPIEAVRRDPRATARAALEELESRADRILVHFDVDVTELPAVDVAHAAGLPLATALAALGVFLSSPACCGLVVTELNPLLDPDGSCARRLATGLAEALAAALLPPGRRRRQ